MSRAVGAIRGWGLCALLWTCIDAPAPAADAQLAAHAPLAAAGMHGVLKPFGSLRFAPDDDVKCLSDVLEAGDPAKGPSTILLKAAPGCLVAWHYHTAMEQVTVIRGSLRMEMTGRAPATLGPGGFGAMPGKMAHQFACSGTKECLLVVMFDAPYDIFWGQGT